MITIFKPRKIALILAGLATATLTAAGPGHDHGDAVPAVNAGTASPRFEAHSDLFEVVGVLNAGQLAITIDRYASNEPVFNAGVEIESGTLKATATFDGERGIYQVAAATFAKPGSYPISLTINAGDDADILAGSLLVPDPEAGHDHPAGATPWLNWIAIGGLIATGAVAAALIVRRRAGRASHV